MKKRELQAEIDRLWLKVGVLQERIAELESRQWVLPSQPYQPYQPFYPPMAPGYPPVTCGDKT